MNFQVLEILGEKIQHFSGGVGTLKNFLKYGPQRRAKRVSSAVYWIGSF